MNAHGSQRADAGPLSLTVVNRTATMWLERPPANAWDHAQLDRLEESIARIRASDDVAVVVVRTAIRHFSAGGDIKMMAAALEDGAVEGLNEFVSRIQSLFSEWASLPVPTVAVIRGAATGGGLELALACDLRIAADTARIGLPEVKLGLLPAGGGTQRLAALSGQATALRLMLTGELVDGVAALGLGIVQWCVPEAELDSAANEVVETLLAGSTQAQRQVKRCVGLAGTPQGYEAERAGQRLLHATADTQRRLALFVENRRR